MINLCREYEIVVTAYGPLGRPGLSQNPENDPILLDDPKIKDIAVKYNRTVAQILLRYLVYTSAHKTLLPTTKDLQVPFFFSNSIHNISLLFDCDVDYARIACHSKVFQSSQNHREFSICRFRPCNRGHGPYNWAKS